MFAYWLLKGVRYIICHIPPSLSRGAGRFMGGLVFFLDRRHRRIALKNLDLVYGNSKTGKEKRRIGRKSFSNLGFNLVEFLRIPRLIGEEWKKQFRVEGAPIVRRALKRGKGIIFILAHLGNWEYLGFSPRLLGFRGAAVGQDIKNPAIDGLVKDTRETIGLEIFPKFEVTGSILSYLKNNGCVAILADQRARKMNLEIDFFGRPALTTAAPAIFARKSGAALIPALIYFENESGYRIVFKEEIEIPARCSLRETVVQVTGTVNSVFEEAIRRRPEEWLWGHRRWRGG